MADDFLDGGGVFVGGSPVPPIVPAMNLDLGDSYRPSDFVYGRDYSGGTGGSTLWQKLNGVISPIQLSDKVAIGAVATVYDEMLYVYGRIYPSSGLRLGSAATITLDGSNNIVFSDSVSGSVTLAQLLAAGSGNVLSSGTPVNGQIAQWISSTTIQGINVSILTLAQSQITNLVTDLAGKASTIHNFIDTTNHPASGLTTGQFLKALSPTTYGFVSHGLTATDIGLSAVTNNAQVRKISSATNNAVVRWDGASGDLVQDSLMTVADDGTPNIPIGTTYNINGSPHTHAGMYQSVDATLTALAGLDSSVGFIYQTAADTFTKYGFAGTGVANTVSRSDHNHAGTYVSDVNAFFGTVNANYVYASPDSSAGSPTFRALVSGDIPSLAQSKITNLVTDLAGKQPIATILTTLSALSNANGYLYNNGAGVLSWSSTAGAGNVSNSGTPVDNQIAIWVDATTIEGISGFTFNYTSPGVGTFSIPIKTIIVGASVAADNAVLSAASGTISDTWGVMLELKGGLAYTGSNDDGGFVGVYGGTGDGSGVGGSVLVYGGSTGAAGTAGNVYICSGYSSGTGWGNIYFGTSFGPTGHLPAKTSETNVVYYDTSTGKLSYGAEGAGGSGDVYKSGTPVNNQVAVWTDDHTIEGHTGLVYDSATGSLGVSLIDAGDGSLKHLEIRAGDASGGAGTDAGNLILKAGDAINADTGSTNGIIYIVPGNPNTTGGISNIYLGNSSFTGGSVVVTTVGTQTNMDLSFTAKGVGSITFNAGGYVSIVAGYACSIQSAETWFGGGVAAILSPPQNGGSSDGNNITLRGGQALTASYNGGNVYLYGGGPGSGGTRGNVYFGTGSTGYLPAKTSETNTIYYDSTTGKISYGAASLSNHDLVSSYHTASGLTTGHFLKATSTTTFSFGAHGLTYTDVGAAAAAHGHAESTITFTDITTGNATTGNHGYLPKLAGGSTNFLRADGTWAVPSGGTNYWQRISTTLSPATTGDLVQVNTYYVGANSEGTLNASSNTSLNISASDGLVGTTTGRSLYLLAGAPYNTAGADAGNVYIRAGAALSADSNSTHGNVYISPGTPYSSSITGTIFLGDSNYGSTSVMLIPAGSSSNISLYIRSKGTSSIQIGDGANNTVSIFGSITGIGSGTISVGNSSNCTIIGAAGTVGNPTGFALILNGGDGYSSGNNNGGDVRIFGGTPNGSGARGNVLLGYDGSTAYGYVGIRGAANSSYALYVTGSVYSTGTMYATDFVQTSDERLKTDIIPYVPKYMDIQYKRYRFKSNLAQERIGVIAQDIAKINPDFVRIECNGELSVSYFDLLVAEVAYLKDKIKQLENERS